MADPNRTLVDSLVLHHAVTDTWEEKSAPEIAQWFSDNGFKRAYGSNPANWSGLINPFTGQKSYSQTQYVGQRVDERTPDATDADRAAGYRIIMVVDDPFGQIAWHAGNWAMNCRSIAIENLGDYRNISLRENDCKVIADFWRGRDRQLNGATMIYGHQEVSDQATACPSSIMNSRDHIVDLVNAPDSGWPLPPTPVPVVEVARDVYNPNIELVFNKNSNLVDIPSGGNLGNAYNQGSHVTAAQLLTFSDGSKFYRTQYSSDAKIARGWRYEDLTVYVEPTPPPAPVITTEDVKTEISIPFSIEKQDDPTSAKGTQQIKTLGKNGIRTVTTRITYTDGVETNRTVVSDETTKNPVTEIVLVGSKEPDVPAPDPDAPNIIKIIADLIVRLIKAIFGKK